MIIYDYTYEREGNDSWLIDNIKIHHDSMGLYMTHKLKWNGWGGTIKDYIEIDLDIDDIEKSQKIIDEYVDNNNLYHEYPSGHTEGININLKELL